MTKSKELKQTISKKVLIEYKNRVYHYDYYYESGVDECSFEETIITDYETNEQVETDSSLFLSLMLFAKDILKN